MGERQPYSGWRSQSQALGCLIAGQNGEIEITSTLGKGTTVTICMPRGKAPASAK